MQHLLAIDRLDGSVPARTDFESFYQEIFKAFSAMPLTRLHADMESRRIDSVVDGRIWHQRIMENVRPDVRPVALQGIQSDDRIQKISTDIAIYNSKDSRNIIFNRDLSDTLSSLSVDVGVEAFPQINAYLEIPNLYDEDGDKIEFLFVHLLEEGGLKILSMHGMTDSRHVLGGRYELIAGSKFSDAMYDTNSEGHVVGEYVNGVFQQRRTKSKGHDLTDKNWVRTVVNCLLYLSNPDENLKTQTNTFATKKKKAETQKKIYTQKPFIRVGDDFQRTVLMKETEFGVRGHFRWQPCGPQRSQVKLTLVKPHKRTKKTIQEELSNPLKVDS